LQDSYEGLAVWRLSFNMAASDDPQRWSYDNPILGRWFETFLRRTQPDIVHFQAGYLIGIAPLVAAVAAGIPTMMTLHDHWYVCPRIALQRGDGSLCSQIPDDPAGCAWCARLESRRYRIPDQLTAGLFGRAVQTLALDRERGQIVERRVHLQSALALPDAVVVPSDFLAQRIRPFVAPDRLHLSRLGLETDRFVAQQRPAPDGVLRIGFTGHVAPHKGVHLLIEAFRKLAGHGRSVELHIYGSLDADVKYVRRLRQMAGDNRNVYFHGRFENQQVATILGGLDVAVVPSICYENSPLAILEAQAAGIPVLAAAIGGMPELVRDGVDGLHFAPANAADLAHQLQRLIDEPELLPALRSGVKMPRDIDDEMLQLSAIYQQLAPQPAVVVGEVVG
jgi:glycosyltransferase involved in cell wall biosynthesis